MVQAMHVPLTKTLQWLATVLIVILVTYAIFNQIEAWVDNFIGENADENLPETVFFLILGGFTVLAAKLLGTPPLARAFALGPLPNNRVIRQVLGLLLLLFVFERLTIATGLYGTSVGLRGRSIAEATAFGVLNSVLLAPLIEELLFRGLLFTELRRYLNFLPTLILTAFSFALFHLENGWLFVLFVLPTGFLLGYVREKSGTITLGLLLHAFMNSLIILLGFLRAWKWL